VSVMLSSSEARETKLRTQVKDLQTRLNEKENLLSSAEAGKAELQTQLAFKAELLSEKEDMS
jgi:ribosome-binding protein aMBF1 (putative translation factor)